MTTQGTNTYQDLRYGYDPGGNVTAIVDPIFGTQSFRYDDLDRLISATGPYGSGGAQATRTYGYDQIGNLILHCTLGDLAYPASGVGSVRPHAVCATGTTSCAAPTYQYDLNGNLTSNPTLSSLIYDFENRPTSITKSGVTTTLAYHDLLGRVTKTVSGTTTTYAGPFYECVGATCTKYIFAGDLRVAMKSGTTVTYVHPDHLSSSSVLTNGSDGSKNEQITYYPFGQTRTDTDGSGTPISPGFRYKYTDQEFDDATGLYFYQARYYDPVLGRFIQPDPIVPDLYDPQALNPYSYVLNNPLRYTDTSGLQEDPVLQMPEMFITGTPLFLYPGIHQFGDITTSMNPATFSFAPGAASVTPMVEVSTPSTGPFTVSGNVNVVLVPSYRGPGARAVGAAAEIAMVGAALTPAGGAEIAAPRIVQRILQALLGTRAKAATGTLRPTTDFLTEVTVESFGKIIAQGTTVDLRATIQGIRSGSLTPRDVFLNKERLLPSQPLGYYSEYLYQTPGISGAGPQRIISGFGGELYYTPNHYRTFIPLN